MTRPTDRSGLLTAMTAEFEGLKAAVGQLPEEFLDRPGACDHWSVKDIMAHLDAWHEMFLGWEAEGSSGTKPAMPAAGYSWSDTPRLNQTIYERCAADPWPEVVARLDHSSDRVAAVISSYTNDELFTKKRYPWTGSTSIGSYAISATSSHYAWAAKLIRRFAKTIPS